MTGFVQTIDDEMEWVNDSLRDEVAADLGVPVEQLDADTSFLTLGLDSMRLMAWMHRLRKRGHKIKLKDLYQEPTLKGWSRLLRDNPAQAIAKQAGKPKSGARTESRAWPTMTDGEPFALTPVQHAYLVGRASHQTLGGVGCHLYQEFDGVGLAADTLEQAIGALIERHPMLMLTFLDDGRQQYRPGTRWQGLTLHDLRSASAAECDEHLQAMRETHGHRVLAVEQGQNIDFQLTLLPDGHHRLHADIDLLVLDAASFSLVFDELAALVRGERLPDTSKDYDFRSYLSHATEENRAARDQSQQFWMERLDTLPDAPDLPLAHEPEQIKQVHISRRREEIQAEDWARFKNLAGENGVTPTMALATCFSAVLARWCGQSRLLLNLTLFDREPLHPAVDGMIADFTNILLLDMLGEGELFAGLAQANQQTFTDAYEHRHWSGVELLRELRRTSGAYQHGAPVVFTSNLGRPLFGQDAERTLGAPGWGISQTPQVWIDHLAYEHCSSVFLQWDSNDALFPPGMLDAMFSTYVRLVRYLLAQPTAWRESLPDLIPQEQLAVRARINAYGDVAAPEGLLHEGVWRQASERPEAVALIHGERSLTYAELAQQAQRCAGALVARGVQPGDRVAVSMSKGIGQIVSVLGILFAGAVYVPVSLDQPLDRRRTIYQGAGSVIVLVCRDDSEEDNAVDGVTFLAWQDAIRHKALPTSKVVGAGEPAYIIYTSGSTGVPKGVIISHRGALNTCAALNRRYAVTADDRVLGLSALHFDLSVYDIFGLLSAGGALVLVDENQRRDPGAWCKAIEQHGVTLWDTVPALFDMLLTYSEGFELQAPSRLRAVMLSGDWIGLDLPARYRAFREDGEFVAMGGATEASIWSNVYDVNVVAEDWRSIPYGYPLARQKYRVADAQGRDCPDWVPGELWIGGEGVALGYFNDPERTAEQFVTVEDERWYRTGDMGCYWPDGKLEFLGRRDKQVKVGGYRIELGEIEAALLRVEGVRSAIAMAVGEREKSLAAFIVPQGTILLSPLEDDTVRPADYAALLPGGTSNSTLPEHDLEVGMARLVASFLFEHLNQQGVDLFQGVTAQEARHQYRAQPHWDGLLGRWLEHLRIEGFVRLLSDGRYVAVSELPSALPLGEHPLRDAISALTQHHEPSARILRGAQSTRTLLDHPLWAPERLLLRTYGMQTAIESLAATVRSLAQVLGRPVRLHEVGARSGLAAAQLLQLLQDSDVQYVGWDESAEMVLRASTTLQGHVHAQVQRWHAEIATEQLHQADLVWANNALHRLGDAGIQAALDLAAPSALVVVHELRRVSSLALVSAELLGDGEGLAERVHDLSWWQSMLGGRGMQTEASGLDGEVQWLALRAPREVLKPDNDKLTGALRELLPTYMVPQRLFFMETLPLTANGKVDHRALMQRCRGQVQRAGPEQELPNGETEQALAALWCELLKLPGVHRGSHFFQLGGDSLLATRLIGELARRGFAAELADLFNYPVLANFAVTLRREEIQAADALSHDPAHRYESFVLTDVQQAYLVGRQPGFALGGVGSHFFVEFEVADLDVARFEQAINRLILRHDTLRTVVRDDKQQVLEHVPSFRLHCHLVSALDGEDTITLRDGLARQVLDPSRWPVFDIQAAQAAGGSSARLFVCLDNLMLDGLSMQILLAELEQLYTNPDLVLPELEIGFRDYLEHVRRQPVNALSQAYWMRRLDGLPAAPDLPLRCEPAEVSVPYFARLTGQLPAAQWDALKKRARAEGLTPSALLLAAYAATLSAWASRDELCLNLTLFDRQPLHPQVEQVLGDFTTLLLLAWQPDGDWRSSAHQLQQRLRQDLLHRDVSAIQVMRQLAQRAGQASAAMPVVFTSALGFEQDRFLAHASWMKPNWGLSHTPQVWLDHQVYESEGELRFNWDYVEQLFEPLQIQTMFERYVNLLLRLASEDAAWDLSLDALMPRLENAQRRVAAGIERPADASASNRIELREDDPLVTSLCHHFEDVVGLPIRPRQSFFDAGATSLKLVQLHVHLTRAGYGGLVVTDLFAQATPLALAAHLQGASATADTTTSINQERRDLLAQRKARAERRRGSTL